MLFLSPPLNYEYRIYLIKYIIIFNMRLHKRPHEYSAFCDFSHVACNSKDDSV